MSLYMAEYMLRHILSPKKKKKGGGGGGRNIAGPNQESGVTVFKRSSTTMYTTWPERE